MAAGWGCRHGGRLVGRWSPGLVLLHAAQVMRCWGEVSQDSVKEMVGRNNARFCLLVLVCFPSFAPGLSLLPPRIRVTLSTGFPPGLVSTERLCIVLGS